MLQDSKKQWDSGEEPMLEPAMDPIRKRALKKPKPIIEGINSAAAEIPVETPVEQPQPVAVPTIQSTMTQKPEVKSVELTEAEKVLMSSGSVGIKEISKENPAPKEKEAVKPQITIQKEDPRLLSKAAVLRANRPANALRNLLLIIILALLAIGAYELFDWYQNRPSGLVPVINQAPTPTSTAEVTPTPAVSPTVLATPTSVPSPTAVPKINQLKINSTPTGYLNVRNQPSTGGKQIIQVHPGEVYQYTQVKNGWYEINLPGGQSGWVTSQYVTLQ